jgi:site-specific DNA-cytosine methylase
VRLARRGNREALKAYGNSVVPAVVALIGKAILEADRGQR